MNQITPPETAPEQARVWINVPRRNGRAAAIDVNVPDHIALKVMNLTLELCESFEQEQRQEQEMIDDIIDKHGIVRTSGNEDDFELEIQNHLTKPKQGKKR